MQIAKESINTENATELLEELSDTLNRITGNSGKGSFDVSDMNSKRAVFAVARLDGVATGCGAIRELTEDTAELKRMYAREKGHGVGGQVLCFLEQEAAELGYERIILETRKCNEAAVNFYLKHNYKVIPNYGKYVDRPEAICFEKKICG